MPWIILSLYITPCLLYESKLLIYLNIFLSFFLFCISQHKIILLTICCYENKCVILLPFSEQTISVFIFLI